MRGFHAGRKNGRLGTRGSYCSISPKRRICGLPIFLGSSCIGEMRRCGSQVPGEWEIYGGVLRLPRGERAWKM